METLRDSIEIKTTPEVLFKCLINIFSSEENYRAWHRDHVTCQWIKGDAFEKGSILYMEEYLHGELHKMKCLATNYEPNRTIEYKLLFPVSIICPKGSFAIEQKEKNCTFTATLYFRFSKIFSLFDKRRKEALEKHMKEEGENLKKLLET